MRANVLAAATLLVFLTLGAAYAVVAVRGERSSAPSAPTASTRQAPASREEPVTEVTVRPAADLAPPARIARTYTSRGGAVFNVDPEEATVSVDGRVIGIADDWDGMMGGRTYRFRETGTHYVKLSMRNHATAWVAVVVTPHARRRTADVDLELQKLD